MYQGPKLVPKPMLKQSLTPGLVQMVSILAMNKLELEEAITEELLENPLLDEAQDEPVPTLQELNAAEEELRRAPADGEILAAVDGAGRESESALDGAGTDGAGGGLAGDDALPPGAAELADRAPAAEAGAEAPAETPVDPFDEIDYGSFFDEYLDPGYQGHEREEIEKPSFETFLSAPTGLSEHLRWQLSSVAVSAEVREAAEAIIGNLDEDGYLTAEDERGRQPLAIEEIAQLEQLPLPAMREALALVQSFDPAGVGARDLRECLLLQLRQWPVVNPLTLALVSDHLAALESRQYREIARALAVSVEDVMAALELIKKLDPHPGRRYNKAQPRLIEPDVFFVKGRPERCWICEREDCPNQYRVVTNDDGLPQLSLNRHYRLMKWDKSQRDVARYIRDRYASAIQFLKNLEQRKQTIARVCHAIIARQGDFLDHGIDRLRPMMIKEVAEEIGVHPSTVSRAVANKYAHTPQGVLELRFFFTEAVQGARGGETSLLILKRRVKKLIDEEDPGHPLTDERITEILRAQGIDVTRRTVAKYREDMHIPSTHRRRRKA
ncbi:MAG TPA: RNA polymerase factor sigma-54 [Terriglobales bacterium]|nr:RNA polymerase factor sigma-54 [Terriglobales bacterium]